MFGLNPIRKVDRTDDSLLVHSLFPTLQGEGPFAGQRAVFLRLAGCSLACSWCDTEFEEDSVRMPNEAIVMQLEEERVGEKPLCVITGGEPMRQNLAPLVKTLLKIGWRVQIETAGVHWIPGLDECEQELIGFDSEPTLTIVCSPKTPKLNPVLQNYCKHYKYIVNSEEPAADDGLPLYAVSQAHKPQAGLLFRPRAEDLKHVAIYVQPLDLAKDPDATQKNIDHCVALVLKHGYRLSLQQHKILSLP